MNISGVNKFSTIDFPGQISCIVFTCGCNYNCFYCHNRDTIVKMDGDVMAKQVLEFLEKRIGMIEGVVISGGEPTLQPDLKEFITKIKNMGYLVKLDTNGSKPDIVKELLEDKLLDYVAVDLKGTKEMYPIYCGKKAVFSTVMETVNLVLSYHVDLEMRTTVFPSLTKEDVLSIAKSVPPLPHYSLNAYHIPEHYPKEFDALIHSPCFTKRELEDLIPEIRKYQPTAKVN